MVPSTKDRILTSLLNYLPHHLLSSIMYKMARSEWPPLKKLLIEEVANRFKIDIFEAKNSHLDAYPSFNAFFTRALKPGVRPISKKPHAIVSPVDGKTSQAGEIHEGRIIQAKGHDYSLSALLAGDSKLAEKFQEGSFVTIYLSPRDYHRIHMPYTGKLREMHFVPGKLFSVSEATTQLVPSLFARNERVINVFDTEFGTMAVIFVGAIFVGSMETVWHGEVRGPNSDPTFWHYNEEQAVTLEKGEEMGRFNMGSTVILLLPPGISRWEPALKPGVAVRVGQCIGQIKQDPAEMP